ncbi:MAG: winged helix-turn-helix domain-containing protein [Candidatus Bathyarchaeia archaeon]
MRRSKLEQYIDILKILAHHNGTRLTYIMRKANINSAMAKHCLDSLEKQNLITKQELIYIIQEKGIAVLKYFREISQNLPITETEIKQTSQTKPEKGLGWVTER